VNIIEATKKAIEQSKCIARTDWPCQKEADIKVKPTDTPDCCLLHTKEEGFRRGWQPQAEDLISDCWVVVD
jgi:hypothetical protein